MILVQLLKDLLPGLLGDEDPDPVHQQYVAVWRLEGFQFSINSSYLLGWVVLM